MDDSLIAASLPEQTGTFIGRGNFAGLKSSVQAAGYRADHCTQFLLFNPDAINIDVSIFRILLKIRYDKRLSWRGCIYPGHTIFQVAERLRVAG